ncbi:MAG: outer membrane protein transport protein [Muribaculaceae bacterium]|nr:outer membrane protein transport protein [Muribaculaceae bacterium]
MIKKYITAAAVAALPSVMMAQSAIDAYNMSQSDLRGTARFMSMAGAFGALGGDLSTLTQNPAGIGVYRGSEIGITIDLNMASSKTGSLTGPSLTDKSTHFYCNNLGYVGTARLDSETMPFFSWGASYNRAASFDRTFSGAIGSLNTSMSNYVANFSNGYSPDVLGETTGYNPFVNSDADWMSIMAYNSYMISPSGPGGTYNGLWVPGTTIGNSEFSTRERGYVDEYSINFGGNVMNTVYWGLGIGITDISMTSDTYYDEELNDADVYDKETNSITPGNAYTVLRNHSNTSGNGVNIKLGVIVKPINEFRIGLAVHTPTWYNMSTHYASTIDYSYGYNLDAQGKPLSSNVGQYYSDDAYYDWHMRSPWRLIASAAGVIGGRFIISADYEYKAYQDMRVATGNGYGTFETDPYITQDVKAYYKPTNTLRLGAELRVTPQFSVRAGYSHSTTSVNKDFNDGLEYVTTTGTNPAYTFNKGTDYITLGLGYRTGGFYIDAAYVYKKTASTWHGFTSFDDVDGKWAMAPMAKLDTNNNNLVLSIGYKF